LGPDDVQTPYAGLNLANAYRDCGRYGDALGLSQDIYDRRHRMLGDEHPDSLIAANNLAGALNGTGRHGEALRLSKDTHDRSRRVLGDEHPPYRRHGQQSRRRSERPQSSRRGVAAERGHSSPKPPVADTYDRRRRVLGDHHHDTLDR
jgi:hypothetical protein